MKIKLVEDVAYRIGQVTIMILVGSIGELREEGYVQFNGINVLLAVKEGQYVRI